MGLGHECSATFLAIDDELDLIAMPMKAIQNRQVTFPRHPKGVSNTLSNQTFDQ
jgi:hypothetical protein